MVALTVLVIIFIVLLAIGLLIFASFFVINKVFLHKLTNLMAKYNKLSTQIYSINFYKIEILIKSDLPIKLDLSKLKKIYADVYANSQTIYSNLFAVAAELNVFNLKTASKHLKIVEADIKKTENDLSIIKAQYDKYTSYGDTIDNLAQSFEEIYEALYTFFWSKVIYAKRFKVIQKIFNEISLKISEIPSSKNKFDYTKTINTLIELRKKLVTLVYGLEGIMKFQAITEYLKNRYRSNAETISKTIHSIDASDLQMVKKQQISFQKNFNSLIKNYLDLNLPEAKKYALLCCNSIKQISNFTFVHIQTKDLIALSLDEINKQTDTILSNKDKIISSLTTIAKYFVKDKVVTSTFKDIIDDINSIEKLSSSSKAITSTTYSQKLDALKQISMLSKNIYEKKDNIKKRIDEINFTLSKIIQVVSDLNDLYIYFYQLLALVKKIAPNDSQTNDIEALINNNLNLLNEYAKTIIEVEHPDYKTISINVMHMYQTVKQFTNRVTKTGLLKAYATNLFVYSNRYRGNRANAPIFANATKLYKAKEYAKCIELLIPFINSLNKKKK